jgi:hypothetical protein
MKTLIPVIGMHRSGTSAVAGALSHLGVDFGKNLMGPAPSNPKGHFEDLEVVGIHDALLAALGCSWDRIQMRGDWELTKQADAAIRAARNWLSRLNGSGPFGIKDPRMALFAPIWRIAALREGVELRPLIVMRGDIAIMRSLAARNRMSPEQVLHMLERYGAGAMRWYLDVNPVCAARVHFEDLMANPAGELDRIFGTLGIVASEDPRHALRFLDRGLVHG